jgi:hypothetical protein
MSIASSKQTAKHRLNIDLLFALFALALALFILVPSDGKIYNSFHTTPGAFETIRTGTTSTEISFAADQNYWSANCSSGWRSDARCDFITLRTQSCSLNLASVYCSEYKKHLQEDLKK